MGPSGCGNTLLGLLSGKLTPPGGSLGINGARLKVSQISKLVAFVPQDDVMLTGSPSTSCCDSRPNPAARDVPRAQLDGWVRTVIDLGLTQQRHRSSATRAARPLGRPAQARQHRARGGR